MISVAAGGEVPGAAVDVEAKASGARAVEPHAGRSLRIGEVAQLTGTTPRTIRYYEEIGLLEGGREREQGKHRCYTEDDVERLRDIVRLRDLLGLSLEQLSQMLAAESARAQLRRELAQTQGPAERRRLLEQAGAHIATQLELVRRRRDELSELESELVSKQELVARRLAELGDR
ncbi:MAG: MerR family transcriptional regulator [Solirubrobacteraceae bacterium]